MQFDTWQNGTCLVFSEKSPLFTSTFQTYSTYILHVPCPEVVSACSSWRREQSRLPPAVRDSHLTAVSQPKPIRCIQSWHIRTTAGRWQLPVYILCSCPEVTARWPFKPTDRFTPPANKCEPSLLTICFKRYDGRVQFHRLSLGGGGSRGAGERVPS